MIEVEGPPTISTLTLTSISKPTGASTVSPCPTTNGKLGFFKSFYRGQWSGRIEQIALLNEIET